MRLGEPLFRCQLCQLSRRLESQVFRGSSEKPGSRLSPNAHPHHVEVVVEGPYWSLQAVAHRGEHRIKQGEILVPVWEDCNGGVLIVILHSVCEDGCARHLSEKSVGLCVT